MKMYTPLKIFIASPSDLREERKKFVEIVTEVNYIKAHKGGYHLEPIGWEDTLPGVGRPQALINHDLRNCNLFIMLLWERWGTASGQYSSGTEEEFHEARTLNRETGIPEIWVFFKNQTNVEHADSQDRKIIEAFRQKIEFDREILYKRFASVVDWDSMIRSCLCKWIDSLEEPDKNKRQKEIKSDGINQILIEVSFIDWIRTGKADRPEIFFTIKSPESLELWEEKSSDEKKKYLYNQLSEHLYLTLGSNPYVGILRYQINPNQYVLLGTVSFEYGASLEESRIYIANGHNQILNSKDDEAKLLDYWVEI